MSSVMSFTFNAVELCIVNINENPWIHAREVCSALEYQKGRARDVLKKYVSIEIKQHKHELEWSKNSQPDKCYISEEGMYELVFGS